MKQNSDNNIRKAVQKITKPTNKIQKHEGQKSHGIRGR